MDYYFVFDVESVGLFGPPFGYAYVIVDEDGEEHESDCKWISVDTALNDMSSRHRVVSGDLEWVEENIVPHMGNLRLQALSFLLSSFWESWCDAIVKYPGIRMVADCQFPVEAGFLLDIATLYKLTIMGSPHPVLDVNSAMLLTDRDPLHACGRLENEKPEHHPLADTRQSARLFIECLKKAWA